MKPVYQTRLGGIDSLPESRGNCFAACIASIMEIECDEVLQIQERMHLDDWVSEIREWLKDNGFDWSTSELLLNYHFYGGDFPKDMINVPYFVVGETERNIGLHCVIYVNGRIAHDPNPVGNGLTKIVCCEKLNRI